MARDRFNSDDYTGPLKRLLLAVLILCLVGLFLFWRIDSPRVERFRAQVIDKDRNPKWSPPSSEAVTTADVEAYFAPADPDLSFD